MSNSVDTVQETFVADTVGKGIDAAKKYPLDADSMETLFKLMMMSFNEDQTALNTTYETAREELLLVQIAEKRLEHALTITMDKASIIFIIMQSLGSPGFLIMYLYYLQYWCHEHEISHIDFETLNMKIFPMGYPSEQDLTDIWTSQKIGGDNGVDIPQASKSIQI